MNQFEIDLFISSNREEDNARAGKPMKNTKIVYELDKEKDEILIEMLGPLIGVVTAVQTIIEQIATKRHYDEVDIYRFLYMYACHQKEESEQTIKEGENEKDNTTGSRKGD